MRLAEYAFDAGWLGVGEAPHAKTVEQLPRRLARTAESRAPTGEMLPPSDTGVGSRANRRQATVEATSLCGVLPLLPGGKGARLRCRNWKGAVWAYSYERCLSWSSTVALLVGAQVTPANAQLASEDCGFINDAGDGSYGALGTSLTLAAGEKLTISAGAPFAGAPTTITLFVNDIMVASATFPGTVEYVIPTAGLYAFQWHIDLGGPATWTVSCAAAAVDPAAMIAALVDKTLVYLEAAALGPGLKAKLTGVSAAVLARKPKLASQR